LRKNYLFAIVLAFVTFSCALFIPTGNATLSENSWEEMAPMPTARNNVCLANINDKIYALGGWDEGLDKNASAPYGFNWYRANEMYDPTTNTWITKASMPQSISGGFNIAAYEKNIYCLASGINCVYDTITDSWETKTPNPTPGHALTVFTFNDKIYAIGGYISAFLAEGTTYNNTQVYDPATDTWTEKSPNPIRNFCTSIVIDSKVYFFEKKQIQIYDPALDTWVTGSFIPNDLASNYAIAATTGVYAPVKVYFFNLYRQQDTQVFDLQTGNWTTGAPMSLPIRVGFRVITANDHIYAIGGIVIENHDRPQEAGEWFPTLNDGRIYEWGFLSKSTFMYTPFGYSEKPLVTSGPFLDSTRAVIAGVVVVGAVIAVTGVVVYHFKRASVKAFEPS
jgi:hypothetical protein